MQLTLAQGDPVEAVKKFLSQSNVQAGQAARQEINGLPAALATFTAQTEQGPIYGLITFVAHGEATYRIVGFAPVSNYESMAPTFLETAESFAPLTDPKVLGVQPQRLDIVTIERAMSIEEFARAYPSAVDVGTLVLINQVPDAKTVMPAGTPVKRVVAGK